MRVYLSADIEGVTGICAPDEANPDHPSYKPFRDQMAREVAATCRGCLQAGASEIVVKDAHWHARNLLPTDLPGNVRLIRGWSGHPLMMMDGLTEDFDLVMMVGYHSAAATGGHPLAHSFSGRWVQELRLDGALASEFVINAHAAWNMRVPVGLVSGDALLCSQIDGSLDGVLTVPTTQGKGAAAMALGQEAVLEQLTQAAQRACQRQNELPIPPVTGSHKLEIKYKKAERAYRAGFYPGAKLSDDVTVVFETKDYMDVMRALLFML